METTSAETGHQNINPADIVFGEQLGRRDSPLAFLSGAASAPWPLFLGCEPLFPGKFL
ncbi:MAG: hypothetical protein JWP89_1136 [Schlesneria sp.]|nr:hypothetical protein [Schlesneria sp.]